MDKKEVVCYTYKQMDSRQLNFIDYHWKHAQPLSKLHDTLLMTGGLEVAALTGKGWSSPQSDTGR
jgi:hypothetical protein